MLEPMVHHDRTAGERDSPARAEGRRSCSTLTQMEQRVALLVVAGRTNAEVAVELGLSPKTVEWHLSRASRKLGARSREDLDCPVRRSTGERIGSAVE